jgi:hypothetical protein
MDAYLWFSEPAALFEEVVKALLDIGYTSWMSSEYEGGKANSFGIVQADQTMVKWYIQKYLAG